MKSKKKKEKKSKKKKEKKKEKKDKKKTEAGDASSGGSEVDRLPINLLYNLWFGHRGSVNKFF